MAGEYFFTVNIHYPGMVVHFRPDDGEELLAARYQNNAEANTAATKAFMSALEGFDVERKRKEAEEERARRRAEAEAVYQRNWERRRSL